MTMADVEKLLQEFIRQDRTGGLADPLEFLRRVRGADRAELEALIDGYLTHAPRQVPAPETYSGSLAEQIVEQLTPSLAGVSGLWPTVLPELRNSARIKRSEIVKRLASALGVGDREEKVAGYYHQMEAGTLPSEGVSERVLEALGSIVGTTAERLRSMGQALEPGGGDAEEAVVFARMARPAEALEERAAVEPAQAAEPPEWDEVDELFRSRG